MTVEAGQPEQLREFVATAPEDDDPRELTGEELADGEEVEEPTADQPRAAAQDTQDVPLEASSYRLCIAGGELRSEFDAAYPKRQRTSDGWIGDAAHSARKSDHNPDRRFKPGVVKAIDVDKDTGGDFNADVEKVRARGAAGDKRLRGGYIIWRGRICGTHTRWAWHRYTGSNGHFEHAHFSFADEQGDFDARGDWGIEAAPATVLPDVHEHRTATISREDVGHADEVRDLQGHLNAWRRNRQLSTHPIDGKWDAWLEVAWRTFQKAYGLEVDGICGPQGWRTIHYISKGARFEP